MKGHGEDAESVTYEDDGRSPRFRLAIAVAVLVGLVLVGGFVVGAFVGWDEEPAPTPTATWDSDYDVDSAVLAVTHASGESVAVDRVSVTVEGEPTVNWRATNATLTPGEQIVVHDVPAGVTVAFSWTDGEETFRIHEFRVYEYWE